MFRWAPTDRVWLPRCLLVDARANTGPPLKATTDKRVYRLPPFSFLSWLLWVRGFTKSHMVAAVFTGGFQVYVTANPGVETRPPPEIHHYSQTGRYSFLSPPPLLFYNPDSYETWNVQKVAWLLRCLLTSTGLMPSSTWGSRPSCPFESHNTGRSSPPPPFNLYSWLICISSHWGQLYLCNYKSSNIT